MTNEQHSTQGTMEVILTNAIKIPGVRVDRREFLAQQFAKYDSYGNMHTILDKGPLEAGINLSVIDKMAKTLIEKKNSSEHSSLHRRWTSGRISHGGDHSGRYFAVFLA
ncbi:hypothetical protein ACFSQ7_27345 [Paenibacillus rhizoplanae]